MLKSGLVSISFRSLSCEEIITISRNSGLSAIEWGSDVHVLPGDVARAKEIGELTRAAGLAVSSYGAYYRLGDFPTAQEQTEEFQKLIASAKALGTDIIRIWAGRKGSVSVSAEDRKKMTEEARLLGRLCAENGVILSFECHPDTFTDDAASAVCLMKEVNSPRVKMHWQPNQHKSFEYNCNALSLLLPYLTVVHCFNWHGDKKEPLALGKTEWERYTELITADEKEHFLLLEFMPDNNTQSLPKEAGSLNSIISQSLKK